MAGLSICQRELISKTLVRSLEISPIISCYRPPNSSLPPIHQPTCIILNRIFSWRQNKILSCEFRESGINITLKCCTRTTIGRQDFVVSGPATRNKLPVELRTSSLCTETLVNKSRAIAGTTARCAQYMSAQIIM